MLLPVLSARCTVRLFTIVVFSAGAIVSSMVSPTRVIASQQETLFQSVALLQFQAHVARYMVLRQEAAASVAAPRVSPHPHEILARTHALATAIRTRRPAARPGDIFAADARNIFRLMLAHAMATHGDTTAQMIARAMEDIAPCDIRPAVNEPFPWQRGAMVPPYLLAALPALPTGLQYRIVDRDLILLDLDANLVVDILKDALPPEITDSSE